MQKRSARRATNYGRQDEESLEREGREQIDSGDSKRNSCTTDSLIADMAQGFIQAQAKATNNEMGPNNKEVLSLLEKVNNQLEEIKRTTIDKNNPISSSRTVGKQNNNEQSAQESSNQQGDQELLTNLKSLVSTLLQENGKSKKGEETSANSESKDGNKQANKKQTQQGTIDVQTVSQVLAQSQYELANELENSLQKLKQVISESEKIANKISNLLGEETMKKS